MYEGPTIDAFLHGPWLGEDPGHGRADRHDWTGDPRLARVMDTFHRTAAEGAAAVDREEALATMDACGIEAALVVAKVYYPAAAAAVEATHRALAELVAGAAGRLRLVATIVPPELGPGTYWDAMANPRLIEELHARIGLAGVHVTPAPWGMAPDDRWLYPLYAKCVELELALFAYVGMPGPLWPLAPNDPIHLDAVALAFPELTIVGHHVGDPWVDVAVRLAVRHRNYYICTSAWHPRAYPAALLEFLAGRRNGVRGADKVIFATDWPLLDLAKASAAARELPLPPADLAAFMYGNAKELFWR